MLASKTVVYNKHKNSREWEEGKRGIGREG